MGLRGEITFSANRRAFRRSAEFDIVIKAVCGPCNHGWLHNLEKAFRALMLNPIHGFPARLSPEEQSIVAVWAIKTWLFLEIAFAHERGGRVISETPRWLREHNEPPGYYQVRLGQVDAEHRQIMWLSTTTVWAQADKPPIGVMGVFHIGNLLFHIWAPLYGPETRSENLSSLGVGERLAPFFLQVWPNETEEVRWPPSGILRLDDLDRLWPPNSNMIIQPAT